MRQRGVVASEQRLVDDLRSLIQDGEALLRSVADESTSTASDARNALVRQLDTARDRLMELERVAARRVREAAKMTDEWVHSYPWQAMGIAAGVGLAVGILAARS